MSKAHRYCPRVEALEARALPSTTAGPLAAPLVVHALLSTAKSHAVVLHGQLTGTYTARTLHPDTGTVQTLTARGALLPLGTTHATGQLQLPGFIRNGKVTGTLMLSGPHGTLTLALTQTTGKGLPVMSLSYQVTRGTGQYQGASGSGVAVLTETTGGARPGAHAVPTVTLAF